MIAPPHSPAAEESVIGQMLADPKQVGPVIGAMVESRHFYVPAHRRLFAEIVDRYYSDDPIDPLTVAEVAAKDLARVWDCDEATVIQRVASIAEGQSLATDAVNHAKLVKRDADYRALLELSAAIRRQVESEAQSPDEIGGVAAQTAMQIATASLHSHEIVAFEDLGRRFVASQRRLMAARAQGIELGAYFGLSFLDSFTRGLQPTELFILAGEPGAGKSAVAWKAAQMFAERQLRKDPEQRIGTFVASLEMGEEPSNVRLAQTLTGLDGGMLREGKTTQEQLKQVIDEWAKRAEVPLYFNFTSTLRASQLRALIVESIRRHNVGLVVIDHMRYFDMDGHFQSKIEEEEEKARFLKEQIAKELNVAVMVLAHTTKAIEQREGRRPKLSDLRGSGQVAAHADFVGFVYRPYNSASQEQIDEGKVSRTDAELIYAKNRHGLDGIARFHFDPSTMNVY